MANNKYIRGLSGRGFRVKNNTGAWKTVKEGAGTNTQVDLEMVSTQDILSRERDNFVRVSGSTATTAILQPLTRKGLRLRPAGGTFTVTIATPGVFTKTAHGFIAGDALVFSTTGALPSGLTAGATYYVIATGLTANTFRVSTALGGSAVNTTGTQSGTHTVTAQKRNVTLGNTITVDLNDGETKRFLKRNFGRWIAASGTDVNILGLQDKQASFRVSDPITTFVFAGANNNLTFEALLAGGEDVTVELADLGVDNATTDVSVTNSDIQVSLAVTQNVQASLTTALTGANNDLVWTAKAAYPGTAGEAITVAYTAPPDNDEAVPLDIVVTGTDIVVWLEVDTDGSTILTTGDDIKTAILADAAANALVTVADAGGNDGSGVVTALTETALAGGVDHSIDSTAANVKTAIEADTPGANEMVLVTYEGTGAGLVEVVAPTQLGADPENLSRGEVVTNVDLTSPFNVGQLRRRFKAWVEA